ncbi:MAG: BamA/TamA family outer membrane protein [bacterium]
MRPRLLPSFAAAALLTCVFAVASRAALAPLPAEGEAPSPRQLRGGRLSPISCADGILFRYRAPSARDVSVVGSFNGWDDFATPMKRGRNGVWRATVELDAGRWPYAFVVDGQWVRDPDNPLVMVPGRVDDRDLGETSFLEIRRGEVVLPRPHRRQQVETDGEGSYDRVNRVSLTTSLRYHDQTSLLPELRLKGGYSFGRERWLYGAGITQPVFEGRPVEIGVDAYRRNATADEFRVGEQENSLATFFFREDWRDYYESEGYAAFVRLLLGENVDLEARWTDEDHRSVSKTTDWGLFGGAKLMRANAPIDDGRLRSMDATWTFDSRNEVDNPSRGWLATAGWDWAGRQLGGDFQFQRGTADVRRYLKLSPHQYFDLRLAAGTIQKAARIGAAGPLFGWAAIPSQERFYLGGVGTMRATQFKSLAGDRMVLANAEMRFDIFRDFQAAVFTDLGDAWVESAENFDLKVDAGVGFQDGDSSFRVNVARKMDGRPGRGDVLVSARIRRMF